MSEWTNYGDVNFVDYGGIMVREVPDYPDDYEFFQLQIDDEETLYAYHGTVCRLSDYVDNEILEKEASDAGKSISDYIKEDPKRCVVSLIENWGFGALEFGARNHNGQGEYSLYNTDFILTKDELINFMRKCEIPEEYIPEKENESIEY